MAREAGFDRVMTVFSPEGRLYQIEYAFKAVKASGLTSIGIRGDDSVVFITQKRVQDKLIDASSITHLFKLTEKIGCVVTGMLPDSKALVAKARQMAAEFEFDNGYPIPVHYLARKIADENQIYTQAAYKRASAVVIILGAVDDEKGPQLYKVDPAGVVFGYKGTSAGIKEQEANNLLEKAVKKGEPLNKNDTIQLAITTMQSLLSSDFKAEEIEISICEKNQKFRTLTSEEIDQQLTAIAEKN